MVTCVVFGVVIGGGNVLVEVVILVVLNVIGVTIDVLVLVDVVISVVFGVVVGGGDIVVEVVILVVLNVIGVTIDVLH